MKKKALALLILLILIVLGLWLGLRFFNKGQKTPDKTITHVELKSQRSPFSRPNEFKKRTRKPKKRATGMKKEDYNAVWDSAKNHIQAGEYHNSDCRMSYDSYSSQNPNYQEKILNPRDHGALIDGLKVSLLILNNAAEVAGTSSFMHNTLTDYEAFEVDRLRSYLLRLRPCDEPEYEKLMNDVLMSFAQVENFDLKIKKEIIANFLESTEHFAIYSYSSAPLKKSLKILDSLSRYKLINAYHADDISYLKEDLENIEVEFERSYANESNPKKRREIYLENLDRLNLYSETILAQIERIRFELTE